MAFVPYMAAGFAVDKLMGGNGMKGALLGAGGSFLPSMLASGALSGTTAAATELAGSAFPSLLTTAGGAGQAVGTEALAAAAANAPSGIGMQGISPFTPNGVPIGQMQGLFGQDISNQVMTSGLNDAKGFFGMGLENAPLNDLADNPLTNLLGQGKDYIDEGYDNMSFVDKAQSGMMLNSSLSPEETPMIVPPAPPLDRRNPIPTVSSPLVTQVQGVQGIAPQNMIGQLSPEEREQYYSLLRSI